MSKVEVVRRAAVVTWLPTRRTDAHKSDCGRIYIVAGSRGMTGASVLVALGALRAGAGLVKVATPTSQLPVVAKRVPLEAMTEGLPDTTGQLSGAARRAIESAMEVFRPDVVAVGPGLGRTSGVQSVVADLLKQNKVPVVLDADGLTLLAKLRDPRLGTPALILTPHEGELSRLLSRSVEAIHRDRPRAALDAARRYRAVCLLKGAGTLVTDGRRLWKNKSGNPAMASGGMGDLLTGLIAGLWGQMSGPARDTAFRAACLGALLHGAAGDLAHQERGGLSVLASDVAGFVPKAIAAIRRRKS